MGTAGGYGRLHEVIDLGPAARGDGEQPLGVRAGIAELSFGERLEEWLDEQHHEGVLADDHAGRVLVCEPGLEREAELGEEVDRAFQIPDGKIEEHLAGRGGGHGVPPTLVLFYRPSPGSRFIGRARTATSTGSGGLTR